MGSECPVYLLVMSIGFPLASLSLPPCCGYKQHKFLKQRGLASKHIGMKFSGQEVLQPKGFQCPGYLNQTLMNLKLVDITSTRICSIFAQFQVNCQKVSGCKFQSILSKNLALNLSYLCRNREVQTWYQVIATQDLPGCQSGQTATWGEAGCKWNFPDWARAKDSLQSSGAKWIGVSRFRAEGGQKS